MADAPEGGGLVFKPMEQFEVGPIFGGTELSMFTITAASCAKCAAIRGGPKGGDS